MHSVELRLDEFKLSNRSNDSWDEVVWKLLSLSLLVDQLLSILKSCFVGLLLYWDHSWISWFDEAIQLFAYILIY